MCAGAAGGGGGRGGGAPFPDSPPLQGSCEGDPPRDDGGGGVGGDAEVLRLKLIPHDALIIGGGGGVEKSSSRPLRSAGGAASLAFRPASLDCSSREPLSQPTSPPPSGGARTPPPPRARKPLLSPSPAPQPYPRTHIGPFALRYATLTSPIIRFLSQNRVPPPTRLHMFPRVSLASTRARAWHRLCLWPRARRCSTTSRRHRRGTGGATT